jgi:hypothetical protein
VSDELDLYRSIGNIEATQEAMLAEIKNLRNDFKSHVESDAAQFADIEAERNKAKGAGYVVLALLTGLATLVGSAVMAVLSGWLKF